MRTSERGSPKKKRIASTNHGHPPAEAIHATIERDTYTYIDSYI